MTKKTHAGVAPAKAISRVAAVAAVLLTLCLVFMMPVGAAVADTDVAKIGDTGYDTLQKAINAVQNGQTITLLKDVTVTEMADETNKVALKHARAVDFTLDLNTYTLSDGIEGELDYLFFFTSVDTGATSDITVTIRNGKIAYDSNTNTAVVASDNPGDNAVTAILNLESLEIMGGKANYYAVEAGVKSKIIADGVTIKTNSCSGGFIAGGGEVILNNCGVIQKGLHTAPYNSMAFAVCAGSYGGKMTINSGTYSTEPTAETEGNGQGTSHGSWCGGVMNSGGTLIINGGTFSNGNYGEDALATNPRGLILADTGAVVEINGGTFNALKGILDIQNNLGVQPNPIVTLRGGTYSASPTEAGDNSGLVSIASAYENKENGDSTYSVVPKSDAVAKAGSIFYMTLQEAVKAAESNDTITLLSNTEVSGDFGSEGDAVKYAIFIDKPLTINGNGKTITSKAQKAFGVAADVTFKDLTIENAKPSGRCIDTRVGDITVNIEDCVLTTTSTGNNQPLTVGGSGDDIVLNLNDVTINAGKSGYGITTFNPVELKVIDSEITGYCAFYFKPADSSLGSGGSEVTVTNSEIKGINSAVVHPSNAFGTFVFESGEVEVTLNAADVAQAISETGTPEYIFTFYSSTGNTVTINSGVTMSATGGSAYFVRPYNDNADDKQNTVTINAGVTSTFPIDSAYLADTLVCLGPVDGKYTITAKTYKLTATEKVGFDSVKVGYSQPEPQIVTITNDCNVPVLLTQPSSTNYVIGTLSATELAPQGTATFTIQPKAGLAVGNYADTITVTTNTSATADIAVSFLVYQPSSGGSNKPVEEPEEPVEPETPEEPVAGEITTETEVSNGGEVAFETPEAGEPEAGTSTDAPAEPVVTGVVLPEGTDSKVTFIPVSDKPAPAGKEQQTKKVFEINVPTYEKGKPATVKFTMTVAELAKDGKTAADVALWHQDEETGEWTKLVISYVIIDGVVYFEAITHDFSPFAIVYEDSPVEEPTEEPTEEPASPAPILAVLAGLGAAAVLRRK